MVRSSQVSLSGLSKNSLLESYRIFVEVAHCASMSAAAWNLDIDVSIVSRHVKAIEKLYQCKLFERHRQGVRLTAAGDRVFSHMSHVLSDEGRMQDDLHEMRSQNAGIIRIAAAESAILGPISDVSSRILSRYPQVKIEIFQASSEQVLTTLRRGEAELGAGFDIGHEPGVEIVASHVETISVFVPPSHPLSEKKEIDINELTNYVLATAERNSGVMRVINKYASRSGVTLEPSLISNSLFALTRVTEMGAAITIGSVLSRKDDLTYGRLIAIPVSGNPRPELRLNFCTLKDSRHSFVMEKFIEELKNDIN